MLCGENDYVSSEAHTSHKSDTKKKKRNAVNLLEKAMQKRHNSVRISLKGGMHMCAGHKNKHKHKPRGRRESA